MSRKRRKNKKNKIVSSIEKQADNLKEQIQSIVPDKSNTINQSTINLIETEQKEEKPQWPDTVQQILDTGNYEIVGNILKKKGTDVGFTLSSTFIDSLNNPKTLNSFLKKEPEQKEEKEPEPEKHDAFYYQMEDERRIRYLAEWLINQVEPISLSEEQAEQAKENLDTVEYFLTAIRKQIEEGNVLTELGAQCLAVNLHTCATLKGLFKDFLYEDD